MKKTTTSIRSKTEAPLTVLEEAAIRYESMRAILGGHKSFPKTISSENDLIQLTRTGIKKSTLHSLIGFMGISMEKMSSLLHTSHRNLQRKGEDDLLDALKSEKVLELASFTKRGMEVLGSEAAFKEWLRTPIPALGNKAPLEFLDTSFGLQMVLQVLGRLEQGVFS